MSPTNYSRSLKRVRLFYVHFPQSGFFRPKSQKLNTQKLRGRFVCMDRYIRSDLFFICAVIRRYYEAQPTGLSSETELRPVSSVLICRHCPLKGAPTSVYNVNVWVTASSLLFAGYVNILEEVNDVTTEPSSKEGSMIDIMLISLLQNR